MNASLEACLDRAPAAKGLLTDGAGLDLTAWQIKTAICTAKEEIDNRDMARIAFLADNSPNWAILALAALDSKACLVPLPTFFSNQQLQAVLTATGCDHIITDSPKRIQRAIPEATESESLVGFSCFCLPTQSLIPEIPSAVDLVTFTSGTTGQPKGVCLTAASIWEVAGALCPAVSASSTDTHLALLPLPILLSSIVAIHASLIAGAVSIMPPLASMGLRDGLNLEPRVFLRSVEEHRPSLLLLVPEILARIVKTLEQHPQELDFVRYVAVGGAPLNPVLIQSAIEVGLPVFEGYGLSEAASVVTMNNQLSGRIGTVGRSLSHRSIRIDASGEIIVENSPFLGYLTPDGYVPAATDLRTGDLGTIDSDGFLTIHGRKSNVIVTTNGRNISPEWIERILEASDSIEQATVHGHGQSQLSAIIRVASGKLAAVPQDLMRANQQLPKYARVHTWTQIGYES